MRSKSLQRLESQKIAIAEKSLRFQITKCKIAGFAAEIAENRSKIAEKSQRFLGLQNKNRRVSASSNRSVFGTLSYRVAKHYGIGLRTKTVQDGPLGSQFVSTSH